MLPPMPTASAPQLPLPKLQLASPWPADPAHSYTAGQAWKKGQKLQGLEYQRRENFRDHWSQGLSGPEWQSLNEGT